MILKNEINESSTTKNKGKLICFEQGNNLGAMFLDGLDSYAGFNLIRFNGTWV